MQEAPLSALTAYLEHDPQPAIVLDPDYRILSANAAYIRQFGEADKPLLGQRCYQVSHHYKVPCDQAGEHCPMRQARETGLPDRVLHVHHTPRGPEHVDVELRPVRATDGSICAYVERLTTVRSASARPSAAGLVGRSDRFNQALDALRRVAPTDLPVLLLGESGTGKELFAQALHEESTRANGRLVVLDCAGLPDTLFESELFGHEKGAFTGALQRKQGLLESAQGGTLFLDEVGDVPLAMQVKLLRLLESQSYRRVGGTEMLHADFRLVAATHQPLERLVAERKFRQDLFYRLNVFPIHLPALRDRRSDIPLIAESLLQRMGHASLLLSADALADLQGYAFPGNIRELRNLLARAALFAEDGVISRQALQATMPLSTTIRHDEGAGALESGGGGRDRMDARRMTDAQLQAFADSFRGTRSELADRLGLSQRTLYRRLAGR